MYRLNQGKASGPWYTDVRALNVENGPIEPYRQALEQLLSRVEAQDGLHKLKRRLVWNFSKAEVESIFKRMERPKSFVGIALEMDDL